MNNRELSTLNGFQHSAAILQWLMLAVAVCFTPALAAQGSADGRMDPGNYFRERADIRKYAVILTGPSVGEETTSRFRQWSFSLHDILIRDYGYSSDSITLLMDRGSDSYPDNSRVDGACDRQTIVTQLEALAGQVKDGDQLTLFLIGHGTGSDEESKFNIVGPDITGEEFAALLDNFDQQDLVIVNTTSASYGFSTSLSSEGRVVISATRSPAEKFDPIFSGYFIEALAQRNGDLDKNNRVSMLEAFNYARQSVDAWYEEQGRLASEHASLDDNGDALFTLDPNATEADGRLAEIAYIDVLTADDANLSPEALALKAQVQELEREVFLLRGRKADFLADDYWAQMEQLLIDLARTTGQYHEYLEN
ncbi:MAG: caspase family protein [Pseudomonadales bacterium]|nr:caspase family protein [Pseudomonadales bacterium]MCP5346746.1 caspase family protein [Pseudomonadales bacterium]